MPTTAQIFYPDTTNWDGTDPVGGDVRKLLVSVPTFLATTICDFGTSVNKDIICDPYTTRNTAGITDLDKFGWSINFLGADGLVAVNGDRTRVIPTGTWNFHGHAFSSAAALATVTLQVRLYKFNASGTRTQIGSGSFSLGLLTAAGVNFNINVASVVEVEMLENESIMVSYYINATGQALGLLVTLRTGASGTGIDEHLITVPSPGVRTRHLRTQSGRLDGVPALVNQTQKPVSARLDGVASFVRLTDKHLTARLDGIATINKEITSYITAVMLGRASQIKQTQKPLSAVMLGRASQIRETQKPVNSRMVGVATMSRLATLFRTFEARMVGVPGFTRALIAARTFSATMLGRATAFVHIPFQKVPGEGGLPSTTSVIVIED